MRFKIFGLCWDLSPVFGLLWSFVGCSLIAGPFVLDGAPWWGWMLYAVMAMVYIATAESVAAKLITSSPADR